MPRLDQLLASLGYGSRRDVRARIEAGDVTHGGKPVTDSSARVDPAEVRVGGEPLDHPDGVALVLNKPLGRVCSHDEAEGPSVYGLLPKRWRLRNPPVVTVGRLDKETTGLLVLTDSGETVHRLTSPKHKVIKVYRAVLDREPPEGLESVFSAGGWTLPGEDKPCAPATLRRLGKARIELELTEGRYHQVRRMLAAHGCSVLELDRIAFGSLALGDLPIGQWRELSIKELQQI